MSSEEDSHDAAKLLNDGRFHLQVLSITIACILSLRGGSSHTLKRNNSVRFSTNRPTFPPLRYIAGGPVEGMDAIITEIGEFGKFQKIVYGSLTYCWVPLAIVTLS